MEKKVSLDVDVDAVNGEDLVIIQTAFIRDSVGAARTCMSDAPMGGITIECPRDTGIGQSDDSKVCIEGGA